MDPRIHGELTFSRVPKQFKEENLFKIQHWDNNIHDRKQ